MAQVASGTGTTRVEQISSGQRFIWVGRKVCRRVQISFLVLLPRCSYKCENPVMAKAISVKTTCFDAIQVYTIFIWKLTRNTCHFLRITWLKASVAWKSSSCFPQYSEMLGGPVPQVAALWELKFPPFLFFFVRTTQADILRAPASWHIAALPSHASLNGQTPWRKTQFESERVPQAFHPPCQRFLLKTQKWLALFLSKANRK